MSKLKLQFKAFAQSLLFAIIGFLMPMHGKRIILITTLHLQLARDGIFREETLEKLNLALRLARFDDALNLPASMVRNGSVWDEAQLLAVIRSVVEGDLKTRPLSFQEAALISEKLVEISPKHFQYGRRDDMVRDFITLFYSQTGQSAAA